MTMLRIIIVNTTIYVASSVESYF